ncbi:hypothetical protein [Streptomyces filipinensis]|uniref:hypothetical protein n=1 Tax=Streptomyces filipinensis TaxID=66887 RepID=UPI00177EE8E8|nr:hypothetical protein [Streptomyces filipinensis]
MTEFLQACRMSWRRVMPCSDAGAAAPLPGEVMGMVMLGAAEPPSRRAAGRPGRPMPARAGREGAGARGKG